MLAVLSLLLACSSGISVTVVNETGAPLEDVAVSVAGAEQAIGTVPDGARLTAQVSPTRESSVTVRGRGLEERAGYVEAGYRGEVTFTMRPDGEVIVADETRPPWL